MIQALRGEIVGSPSAIWIFAALYFACYAPYTALTKSISDGSYPGAGHGVPGATLLPLANIAALAVLIALFTASDWWRHASRRVLWGVELPWPGRATALSGVCTAVILTTTTLAYTFEGISIVFVMLLMRGGVLILAPVVDALAARRTRWFSWVGLALAFAALLVAFSERGGYTLTPACATNIAVYLLAYFVRLRLMSHAAKSDDPEATRRYFVEEQLLGAPLVVVGIVALALLGWGELGQQVRAGFTSLFDSGLVLETLVLGALSQGVILFGSLVFLDARENTYSVPVNRSTSTLAGVTASFGLTAALGTPSPSAHELEGAGLVMLAIVVLALGPRLSRLARRMVPG